MLPAIASIRLPSHPRAAVLAGRYRVEGELARGAMGVVYKVVDQSSGRMLALKQLMSKEPQLLRMFEREFHTLVGLKHPRIIDVYDYGVDQAGPYYTMELLDGSDFRELAPIPYQRACRYLRDVASSLGLLHARRLLHRDLSPRNVRVTSDDRCKLIDFGGLSGFGIPHLVVGTPPCVPPEALHHAPLDQRADLYALGGLAYWLLTGRHAYPAREMVVLPDAWRMQPRPPSVIASALGRQDLPAVPAELDELVMSLLTLNPLGRPASAAEVIDRLTMIGGLDRESDEGSQSYLLGVETVGRDKERTRLRKRLAEALEGRGASCVIEAVSGMGGTALLSELAVAAQLAGALPVVIDGRLRRGPYGLVHGLIDKVLEIAPKDAVAAAVGHEALLARICPALQSALGVVPDAVDYTESPGELRKRSQNALFEWVMALSRRRTLLLAVDNLQRADEPSAALLATLASQVMRAPILLLGCVKPNEEISAPVALRALRRLSAVFALRALERGEVQSLVRSMFGDVPNIGRLADWIHRLSAGNPQACVDLAEHLVRKQVIRYIHGSWALPQEIAADELQGGIAELTERRIADLPADARRLAETLSIHRGYLSLDRCLALAESEGLPNPYAVLQRLVSESVLIETTGSYQFAHDAIREAFACLLGEERSRELHRRIGAILERGDCGDLESKLDAGWHLLHGGEELRGARLLAAAALELTYVSDALGAAVPALRAALRVYKAHGQPAHELARLYAPLAMAGYFADRHLLDEVGEEACDTIEQVLGIHRARSLRPWLGKRLSLYLSLGWAALAFVVIPGRGGLHAFVWMVEVYCAAVTFLCGAATICLDAPRAHKYAQRLEALSWLVPDGGPEHVHVMARLLAGIPEERVAEVIAGFERVIARMEHPIPLLSEPIRKQCYAGAVFALGSLEGFRDGPAALRCAEKLDRVGLKLYEMVADQLRSNYHALRGEVDRAERYRERVEVHAVQLGSAWQVEVWVPSSRITVYVMTGDTIGLKRTTEDLDRLATEIPSLRRNAVLARAEYHHLKGEHAQGMALAWPVIEASQDREFLGRAFAISNHARALNRLGRHVEAVELLEPVIAALSETDRSVIIMYSNLFRELAHARCGLGDHEGGFKVIDEMLDRHVQSDHPLLLGNLHASAAGIAVQAGDVARALEHVTHMEHWFKPTNNPALISQCERLRREVRRMVEEKMPGAAPQLPPIDSQIEDSIATARSMLSQCQGAEQRAQFAYELLLNHVRGRDGFLFTCLDGELRMIAPQHGEEPSSELLERLRAEITHKYGDDQDVTVVVSSSAGASLPPPVKAPTAAESYRTFPLTVQGNEELKVVGVLVVQVGERALQPPQQMFLHAVARSLFDIPDAAGTETAVRRG